MFLLVISYSVKAFSGQIYRQKVFFHKGHFLFNTFFFSESNFNYIFEDKVKEQNFFKDKKVPVLHN